SRTSFAAMASVPARPRSSNSCSGSCPQTSTPPSAHDSPPSGSTPPARSSRRRQDSRDEQPEHTSNAPIRPVPIRPVPMLLPARPADTLQLSRTHRPSPRPSTGLMTDTGTRIGDVLTDLPALARLTIERTPHRHIRIDAGKYGVLENNLGRKGIWAPDGGR